MAAVENKTQKPEKTIPVRRMVSAEQKEMLNLLGIISQMAFLEDGIGQRISEMPKGKFRLKGALSNLVHLANDLTRSMPKEQRDHIKMQLPAIKMIIGPKSQLPRNYDSTYGRWLSFEQLDVVASAIRECCRTCSINDPQEQKQCAYCKLMDVLPVDKPDENARGCGYFTIW